MHRTEGANNVANLFTDGPPGTTVEANILNAFQEEIANVIEQAGLTLKVAATETRDQLYAAIIALSGGLETITIDIDDWDMDTNPTKAVAHGVSNFKNIRSISGIVRNDADTTYYVIGTAEAGGNGEVFFDNPGFDGTDINLRVRNAGIFDAAGFSTTPYNRGWITISYIPG